MNLLQTTQAYVDRLIPLDGRPKILLLDAATVPILSLATTQSQILRHDVFLTDRLANPQRRKMRHLDCIVFVRPTSESIDLLIEELRAPKYGKYTLCFSNLVRKSQLERVAQADENECVSKVFEVFLDFLKINNDMFSCGLPLPYLSSSSSKWDLANLEQASSTLFALIGSLKLGTPAVRFDSNSAMSRTLASHLQNELTEHTGLLPKGLQNSAGANSRSSSSRTGTPALDSETGAGNGSSLVLILDRFNDPITPLISHWTYQAMVDEMVGITNNCVDISDSPDVPAADKQITLSEDNDPFFGESMYLNLGDLGSVVRDRVQRFSSQYKTTQTFDTVDEMKKAVYELPELEKLKSGIAKHVSLVGELQRIVTAEQLLQFSELEQNIACTENHAGDLEAIKHLVLNPQVDIYLKYRITALYGLRYRKHPHGATEELLQQLASMESLRDASLQFHLDRAVRNLLKVYSSNQFPQEDLFNQGSFLMRAQQGLKGLRGVENVYTQHRSLLESILTQVVRGKLAREKYPFVGKPQQDPTNIIVFVIGGVTMEEARFVGEFNRNSSERKIILGGTSTINPKRFLNELGDYGW